MNKKESIRNHAIKVIAREGFYRAKVKDIAEEAGIAAGTVYLYFSSKEDILDYIFLVEHQRRADFVNRLYIKNTPIDIVIESFIKFNYDCFRNGKCALPGAYNRVIVKKPEIKIGYGRSV